jgi:hypothetical protein
VDDNEEAVKKWGGRGEIFRIKSDGDVVRNQGK